jgi:hypothetical protein
VPLCMIRAIDLDHEAQLGREQVSDESANERHLPAERYPEPGARTASKRRASDEVGACRIRVARSASSRDRRASGRR